MPENLEDLTEAEKIAGILANNFHIECYRKSEMFKRGYSELFKKIFFANQYLRSEVSLEELEEHGIIDSSEGFLKIAALLRRDPTGMKFVKEMLEMTREIKGNKLQRAYTRGLEKAINDFSSTYLSTRYYTIAIFCLS